jgi:hypothetical protein
MLNISHKKTTAYYPESDSAVKRLHRRLKDALRARAAAATWSEEFPYVLLGLGPQPREDTGLSLAEVVFGAQIVLPNEFLQNDESSVDTNVKNLSKTLHDSASSLPRHNSSTDLSSELPAELLSAPLVWVRRGGLVPPLQPLYDGLYAVLHRGPAPSPSESGRGTRWLPSAAAADRGARAQGVLPQPSGSRFQTRWSLHLPLLRRRHETVLEPFPTRRGGFCTPRTGGAFTASTGTVPVFSTGTAPEVGPLTSSSPSRARGGPVESWLHPW